MRISALVRILRTPNSSRRFLSLQRHNLSFTFIMKFVSSLSQSWMSCGFIFVSSEQFDIVRNSINSTQFNREKRNACWVLAKLHALVFWASDVYQLNAHTLRCKNASLHALWSSSRSLQERNCMLAISFVFNWTLKQSKSYFSHDKFRELVQFY